MCRTMNVTMVIKMSVRIKRNCSTSIRDRGDGLTFGDITITIDDDHYIKFRELMNEYERDAPTLLQWIIEAELIE